jgi:RNA polymerase sigma factor (sigma-70 family)
VDARYAADFDLAQRCAAGDEAAWERFVLDYRPVLYRAAEALDARGGARELADSLYGELYAGRGAGDPSRSLLATFQGRSSLASWLRAVLSQRYVDRVRAESRLAPLPDEDFDPRAQSRGSATVDQEPPNPDRRRYISLIRRALGLAVGRLADRDRLRLGCYYAQDLTLAETGRLLREHEATVSRQLARTRRAIREDVERQLRDLEGLNDGQIDECFASAIDDPGPIDLQEVFEPRPIREYVGNE